MILSVVGNWFKLRSTYLYHIIRFSNAVLPFFFSLHSIGDCTQSCRERCHHFSFSLLTKYIQIITNNRYPESSWRQCSARFPGCVDGNFDKYIFWWQVKPLVFYDGIKRMKGSLIFWSIFFCLCDNLIKGLAQGIKMTDNAINLKTDTVIFITCKLSEPCNLHNQLFIQFSNFIFVAAFWSCTINILFSLQFFFMIHAQTCKDI